MYSSYCSNMMSNGIYIKFYKKKDMIIFLSNYNRNVKMFDGLFNKLL